MQKIAFVLPGVSQIPNGGYKIVFEYANRLSSLGYDCHLIFVSNYRKFGFYLTLNRFTKYIISKFSRVHVKWFEINPQVSLNCIYCYEQIKRKKYDFIFATSIHTSMPISRLSVKASKIYLIQHWENWDGYSDVDVEQTWKLGLNNIVISKWLHKKSQILNIPSEYIQNGLDLQSFNITKPIIERNKFEILLLGHHLQWKGTKDALDALKICKTVFPNISVTVFSAESLSHIISEDLSWIKVQYQPNKKQLLSLYNNAAIFVAPSWTEGWGLTASEAMQCGCAVVATENGGHQEFAINGYTALTCKIKSPTLLARNILRLISDDELRVTIASNGNNFVQQFNWKVSIEKMDAFLKTKS